VKRFGSTRGPGPARLVRGCTRLMHRRPDLREIGLARYFDESVRWNA
jgi:hypothetical protein